MQKYMMSRDSVLVLSDLRQNIFFLGGTQGRQYRDSENLSVNQIGVFKSKYNKEILLVENK